MTIQRLGQLTAETRVLTDLSVKSGQGSPSISSSQAKTGTYSYSNNLTTGAWGKSFAAQSALRAGYWQRLSSTIPQTIELWCIGNSLGTSTAADRIEIQINVSTGVVQIVRPGATGSYETLLSAPTPAAYLTLNSWFHTAIAHKIHATDGFLSLYVNGVRILNLLGDTRPSHYSGTAQIFSNDASLVLGCGTHSGATSGFTGFIDDFYVDSYVGEVDAPVPARRFDVKTVSGAGANAAWTPSAGLNYQCVDENPNTADTDYVKALAAGLKDTYTFSAVTVPADHRIIAMIPTVYAKRLDSGIASQLRVHAYDGSLYANSSDLDLGMDYAAPVFERLTVQPGGSAWTESAANAATFGIESRGAF